MARHRARLRLLLLLAPLLLALLVALGRVAGPSDLSQNYDQSKTVAYTADVVLHGRWVLPRDNAGRLTTKPPLVNWLGAACVWALTPVDLAWREWALKLPSVLAGLLTVGATVLAALRLSGPHRESLPGRPPPAFVACGAGLAVASSPFFVKHVYFLRPDMLAAALLTVGWLAATVLLSRRTRRPVAWAAALWLAMGLAALTKGFTALLLPMYVVAAAKLVHGRFAAAGRTRIAWGLPLGLAVGLSWPVMVYLADPGYLMNDLLGGQTANRFGGEGGLGHYLFRVGRDVLEMIGWPLEGVGPWYPAALVALVALPRRRWLGPVAGPAIVWVLCVFAIFVPVTHKGASYLLPMYPAMAVLAAVAWLNLPKIAPPGRSLAGLASVAVALAAAGLVYETRFSSAAEDGQAGAEMVAFAKRAAPIVGDDSVSYVNLHNTPLSTLMGRHPGDAGLARGGTTWVVELVPIDENSRDQAEAEHLPGGEADDRASVDSSPALTSAPFTSRQTNHIDGKARLVLWKR